MSNVYSKLQKARVQLQNLKLKKTGKNNYSGFTYYELTDFLPQINKIFDELELFSNFSIEDNTAYLNIYDTGGSCDGEKGVSFTMPTAPLELKGCTAIQALGGLNTYCKRYLYLNALEIVENDLLDSKAGTLEEEPKTKSKPVKDDTAIYEQVAQCQSIEELNTLWQRERLNVTDQIIFKNICASRKAVLQEGT